MYEKMPGFFHIFSVLYIYIYIYICIGYHMRDEGYQFYRSRDDIIFCKGLPALLISQCVIFSFGGI